ncbi:hypothetical protein [uncultured Stenotrophomonas sp.]|uniref:hypothetical protein n=1 Tax=uncultured Stenotrophomonas sp. TaxID=165438 RepID=UPI00258E7097|nr:hypothetical protein [uncultured Stenotrophomonas sp.]
MNLEQIDTSTTAGKARVMQLAAEGRKVVCGNNCPPWKVMTDVPSWDWSTFQYAILAEPVGPDEVWVTVADGKTAIDVYPSQDLAQPGPRAGWSAVRYIRADLAGEKG